MQIDPNDDPFSYASNDVIRTIALQMDLDTILNTCLTSRRFNLQICDNEVFWREMVRQNFPEFEIIKSISRFRDLTWKELFKTLKGVYIPEVFEGFTTLQMVVFLAFLRNVTFFVPNQDTQQMDEFTFTDDEYRKILTNAKREDFPKGPVWSTENHPTVYPSNVFQPDYQLENEYWLDESRLFTFEVGSATNQMIQGRPRGGGGAIRFNREDSLEPEKLFRAKNFLGSREEGLVLEKYRAYIYDRLRIILHRFLLYEFRINLLVLSTDQYLRILLPFNQFKALKQRLTTFGKYYNELTGEKIEFYNQESTDLIMGALFKAFQLTDRLIEPDRKLVYMRSPIYIARRDKVFATLYNPNARQGFREDDRLLEEVREQLYKTDYEKFLRALDLLLHVKSEEGGIRALLSDPLLTEDPLLLKPLLDIFIANGFSKDHLLLLIQEAQTNSK